MMIVIPNYGHIRNVRQILAPPLFVIITIIIVIAGVIREDIFYRKFTVKFQFIGWRVDLAGCFIGRPLFARGTI